MANLKEIKEFTNDSRDKVSNQGAIGGDTETTTEYALGNGWESDMFTENNPWEGDEYLLVNARNLNTGGSNGRLQGDGFFTRLRNTISSNRLMRVISPNK